jgi:hypothetical protein
MATTQWKNASFSLWQHYRWADHVPNRVVLTLRKCKEEENAILCIPQMPFRIQKIVTWLPPSLSCPLLCLTLPIHHSQWVTKLSEPVSGLWSWCTRPLSPHFLNLQLWLLHKSSICINNGKPTKMLNDIIRHLITTMWIIRLLFRLMTYT